MNKDSVSQVLGSLRNMSQLPASLQEKVTNLSERMDLVTNEQFEKWTDGIVVSDAQAEDRHWGFRTELQQIHSELAQYCNDGTVMADSQLTSAFSQLDQMVRSVKELTYKSND